MTGISTIRLRLWLPILILGAITLLQVFSTLYQRQHLEDELEQSALSTVRERLGRFEFRIEYLLSHDQDGLVADEVAQLGLTTEVNAAALLDSDERVLHATRLEWRGRAGSSVLKDFNLAGYRSAQNKHHPRIGLSTDGSHITAYQPVALVADPDQIRPTRIGVLFLDYDLSREKNGLWRDLLQQNIAEWVVALLFLVALQFALGRWLTRPLHHLTGAVRRFSAGDLDARTVLSGSGELAELSTAYNQMREQLVDTLRQLEESHEHLAITLYSIGDAVIATDCESRVTNMNGVAQTLTGWTQEEALGRSLDDVFRIVHAHTRQPAEDPVRRALATGSIVGLVNHTVLIARDGHEYQIADSAAPIRHMDGTVVGVVLVFRDVSEEYALREAVEESEERHRSLFQTMAQGVVYQDIEGKIIDANPAAEHILGLTLEQLKGQGSMDPRWYVVHEDGSPFPMEEHPAMLALRSWKPVHDVMMGVFNPKREKTVWINANAVPQFRKGEDRPYRVYTTFDDLTQRKEAEEKIRILAFYDVLTQLPNRRLLIDRLQQALVVSHRSGHYGALLFIDLDHFKVLNDTQGHDVGDQLLIEVARRLLASVREGDTVSRLGGDEFVVMLEDLIGDAEAAAAQTEIVGEKIRETLNHPYWLKGGVGKVSKYHITPSIGASLFKNNGESVDELLKRADVAMYQAKDAGRNTIRFFDPAMQAVIEARAELESWLRQALPQQFRLYYQMQVDNQLRPIGAEVLLRCEHPERGMLSPLEFIPIAEESGLILPIGQWVLETVCAQLKIWADEPGKRDLQLAVNVSARQFRHPDFVDQLCAVLEHSGANPARLKLELTETLVLDEVENTILKMHQLRALGVSFSLDDFGTGYSSLSYLKRLPLQQVKIDQSFVRDLVSDSNDAAIVQAIIAMASTLGLDVIAEGVETHEQYEFLMRHGCLEFQGYQFSRPVPLADFEQLLK